jgi:hypothetical protein
MSNLMPDPGAGTPLSHTWWLVVLCLIIGGFLAQLASDALRKLFKAKEKIDDAQASSITTLQHELHKCQLRCAQHRQEMMTAHVRRDDFAQFVERFEVVMARLHERIDQIAQKMFGDR